MKVIDESTVGRTLVVKPGMCGQNSLFVGQVGDWTWETVTALCGADVFNARNPQGQPTYLSFYYYHLRGDPHALTFGDRISVTSRVFGFGSESVLALHRISPADRGDPKPFDPDEFFAFPDPASIYVQNFNRWVTRSRPGSNEDLVRSAPLDFRHEHLPLLPERYSPRVAYGRARQAHTFLPDRHGLELGATHEFDYRVDVARDLNGVGLLYFASYFSIVDRAVLELFRAQGRPDLAFLRRTTRDHQLCYLGNADAGATIRVTASAWRSPEDSEAETVNAVLTDRFTERPLAVATIQLGAPDDAV